MSNTGSPIYSQVDGGADQQAPQQGGFFSRLGAGLKKVMPYVTPIANRLAAAAGNYGPLELEHQQKELEIQQAHERTQEALAQSQMQNQELNRQLLQKQIANVRTPEETEAMKPPADVVAPMPEGGMGHYNRSFNPVTKQWETNPTMVPTPVPNPAAQARAALTQVGAGLQSEVGKQTTQIPGTENIVGPQEQIPPIPPSVTGAPPLAMPPVPETINQQRQLPAMQKPISTGGDIEPDGNSPTGFSRVWRGAGFQEVHREPAPAPYAYVPQQTTSTVEQTGPTGLHEVNTTTTTKGPVGAGAPAASRPPQTRPPVPGAFNVQGPEAARLMDQNTTLDATNAIIDRIRASKAQFASLLDSGLITLAADPNTGILSVVASRNLNPQQQKIAGDWQSLAEHINILRQPLGGTGFRGEEAWGALQAQRGKLTQAQGIIDQTLNNTQQILRGLRQNNRRLLGPLDNAQQPTGTGFVKF